MRVIDWNIQNRNAADWPRRREALAGALRGLDPDVLCVQEAWAEQVDFIGQALPGHDHAGLGRDDGRRDGEHCAIFYRRDRLRRLATETFWLSDTPEVPSITWGHDHNRIVTVCRLADASAGRSFTVFNTHFPLTAEARLEASALLARRVKDVGDEPVILTGDFNCSPGSVPWTTLTAAGLASAGADEPTFPRADGGACIDAIFVSRQWSVRAFRLIADPVDGVHPSDHHGLQAALELE
ncbi:MAG: endonuclease/exonuclease/phosphatase family protein [Planctomycetota bacterium]